MNYYNEIKNELINNEITKRVKDKIRQFNDSEVIHQLIPFILHQLIPFILHQLIPFILHELIPFF